MKSFLQKLEEWEEDAKDGFESFVDKNINNFDESARSVKVEACSRILALIQIIRCQTEALEQYVGIAGKDSRKDKEGSRHSAAEEALRKCEELFLERN
jgi:hypothetical protein